MRLAQIDRLFGKGVLFQITEQINQLVLSYGLEKTQTDETKLALSDLNVIYSTRVKNVIDTFQMQISQLELLQQIQYSYDVYSQNTEMVFSDKAMKAIAQTLSEIVFKDIKIYNDFQKTLTYTASQKNAKLEFHFIFNSNDIEYGSIQKLIVETSDFTVLNVETTMKSSITLRAYASALLSADAINTDTDFYSATEVSNRLAINNFDDYTSVKLNKKYNENKLINGILGVDSVQTNAMQMTIYTIYDVLNNLFKNNMFPEQIKEIMDFESQTISEKIFYPTLNAFIALKQGYDNYIQIAGQVSQMQEKLTEELGDKIEFIEIINLMTKQIKNQNTIMNQKMVLLNIELYQDLLAIVVEARNYAVMYETAYKQVLLLNPTICKKVLNEKVLIRLQEKNQEDIEKFYLRMRYILNNFFVR